ncbi:hypothetical protein pipiens_019289 [Culex pipiens pipiens]|uniref:Uncharacterized protein n=1 Tax=Culex pipiens pipiens TaxID=38569 RepID=A0ABD1DVG5_CULPP
MRILPFATISRRSTVTRLHLMTSFNGIYAFMESYDASKQAGELVMRLEKLEPLHTGKKGTRSPMN